MNRLVLLLFCCGSLASCKISLPANARPALVVNLNEQSQHELKQVISKALNERNVTLAKQVFVDSHRLLIQRKTIMGPDGLPIQTRVDEEPIIFELYKAGDSCYIKRVDNQSNEVYLIQSIECRPR
ncbi:hypothetical protein [Aliikangiella sp. G2MR2-5]|uniref:hypothetical protein n=1 Tax=Aliikangiella sp. G2MR2-5 TaxID=2788943 RepID=UPI0018A88EAF|nr:hypothetical protein [Aliikangiella sp. G2MR2-5]